MYFGVSERQANTPIGLSLGLAGVWERPGTKQQTNQPLRRAPTFLEIVLQAGTAAGASDWEQLGAWRPPSHSQAPGRAERQQQGYYAPPLCGGGGTGVWGRAGGAGMSTGDVWRVKKQRKKGGNIGYGDQTGRPEGSVGCSSSWKQKTLIGDEAQWRLLKIGESSANVLVRKAPSYK